MGACIWPWLLGGDDRQAEVRGDHPRQPVPSEQHLPAEAEARAWLDPQSRPDRNDRPERGVLNAEIKAFRVFPRIGWPLEPASWIVAVHLHCRLRRVQTTRISQSVPWISMSAHELCAGTRQVSASAPGLSGLAHRFSGCAPWIFGSAPDACVSAPWFSECPPWFSQCAHWICGCALQRGDPETHGAALANQWASPQTWRARP